MPSSATKKSDTGAKAFTRWWVELVNYSGATGDTATLNKLSEGRCGGCTGLLEVIDDLFSGGGHSEGGHWTIGGLHRLPLDHAATWAGYALGRTTPQLMLPGTGQSTSYPGGPFYL